jgi:hypothetical protein
MGNSVLRPARAINALSRSPGYAATHESSEQRSLFGGSDPGAVVTQTVTMLSRAHQSIAEGTSWNPFLTICVAQVTTGNGGSISMTFVVSRNSKARFSLLAEQAGLK